MLQYVYISIKKYFIIFCFLNNKENVIKSASIFFKLVIFIFFFHLINYFPFNCYINL